VRGRRNLWLLLLAGVLLASWYFGRDGGSVSPPGPAPEPDPEPEAVAGFQEDHADPGPVHLRVLNGTPRPGLAREFGLLLGRTGCVAETVDNAPHDRFPRTMLVNRRLDDDRARDLAGRFGGIPVIREWDDRTSEDAVLVLGADHVAVRRKLVETASGK